SKEDYPCCRTVQSAHWMYFVGRSIGHEVHYGFPCLFGFGGGDVSFRLVQQYINRFFRRNTLAVKDYFIWFLHLVAHFAHNLAVLLHKSLLSLFVGFPAAADSTVGDIFNKADALFWNFLGYLSESS